MRFRIRTALIVIGVLVMSLMPAVGAPAQHTQASADRPPYRNPSCPSNAVSTTYSAA